MPHVQELNYDSLDLIEIPVTIAGRKYVLREADGPASCKYHDAHLRSVREREATDTDQRFDGLHEVEYLLVGLCLFEKHADNTVSEEPVGLEGVKGWKYKVVGDLFKHVEDISELSKTSEANLLKQKELIERRLALTKEDPSKNVSSGTEGGTKLPSV